MDEDGVSQSQFQYCPNSSNFTVHQGELTNYSYVISGAVSLIVTLLLLTLQILYKSVKTTLQRLFLYFTIAVAMSLAIQVLNMELQFEVSESFCSWLGYLGQSIGMTWQILATGLVIFISNTTCRKLWPRSSKSYCKTTSLCCARVFEVLYLLAAFILPAASLSILLKKNVYGLSESLCWIKRYEKDCSVISDEGALLSATTSVIFLLRIILVLTMLFLMIVFHIMILKRQQNHKFSREISCRTSFLMAMVGLSIFAKGSEFIVNMAIQKKSLVISLFYYDLLDELIQTITKVLLTLAFATYLYSPQKLKLSSIKGALKEWSYCCQLSCCCWIVSACSYRRLRRRMKSFLFDEEQHTYQDSVNRSSPSYTTYSTPYTNEFTEITEVLNNGEDKHVQYGSTGQQ